MEGVLVPGPVRRIGRDADQRAGVVERGGGAQRLDRARLALLVLGRTARAIQPEVAERALEAATQPGRRRDERTALELRMVVTTEVLVRAQDARDQAARAPLLLDVVQTRRVEPRQPFDERNPGGDGLGQLGQLGAADLEGAQQPGPALESGRLEDGAELREGQLELAEGLAELDAGRYEPRGRALQDIAREEHVVVAWRDVALFRAPADEFAHLVVELRGRGRSALPGIERRFELTRDHRLESDVRESVQGRVRHRVARLAQAFERAANLGAGEARAPRARRLVVQVLALVEHDVPEELRPCEHERVVRHDDVAAFGAMTRDLGRTTLAVARRMAAPAAGPDVPDEGRELALEAFGRQRPEARALVEVVEIAFGVHRCEQHQSTPGLPRLRVGALDRRGGQERAPADVVRAALQRVDARARGRRARALERAPQLRHVTVHRLLLQRARVRRHADAHAVT